MKIAIITSGILPVPAVQGGAVENLIDFYLDYNERKKLHDITIYSVYNKQVKLHPSLRSKINHYKYINTDSLLYKLQRRLFSSKKRGIYNYHIEFFLEKVCKIITKQQYDAIILENRPGYALELHKRISTPLIAHIHLDMLNDNKYEYVFNNIRGIITVSNYLYSKASLQIKQKCTTVHNGIDLTMFRKPNITERNEERGNMGFEEKDIVLVYSGRISPIKGVKELIESVCKLEDKRIKLLVIGGSFYGNQSSEDEYMQSVIKTSIPIKDQIVFTGFRPYPEIPHFLSICDIAVIPSLCDDAFPTTILEAMAVGLPIIATNRGGIPEQVDEENAILIDTGPNMVTKLTDAIKKLSNNHSLRKKMAQASYQKSSKYEKDIFANKFFDAMNNFIID